MPPFILLDHVNISQATIEKRKRPLFDLKRGCEIALSEIRREARDCARVLCISIAGLKFLTFQETIALQRYVLSLGYDRSHSLETLDILPFSGVCR